MGEPLRLPPRRKARSDSAGGRLTFLEFFAGAGLVRLALEPDWRCVWANDVSPHKAAVYRQNFGDHEFHLGDVAGVSRGELPDAGLAWASFPCQDLSLAGWRRGLSAERSGAFWPFWRLMRDLHQEGRRPPLIVLENVVGMLSGRDFGGLCEALAALDLRVGALVVNAVHFLPQSRPRVFVIAAAAQDPALERAGPADPWHSPALVRAVETLPQAARERWVWWRLPTPEGAPPPIETLVEAEPPASLWLSRQEVSRLCSMMSPANAAKLDAARAEGRRVGFLYRRTRQRRQRAEVRFDGVAGCLRTPAGGSSRQTLVMLDGDQVRMRLLSAREAARLMGAPDSFVLPEGYNRAYHAMGDGVAVPAVRWLARHLLEPLLA